LKIFKNDADKWCFDFTSNGKRVRRIVGLSRQETVRIANYQFYKLTREKFGLKEPPRKIPFDEFAREFLEIYSRKKKLSWSRDETSIAHLSEYFKTCPLSEIAPDMIERYMAERTEAVSPATVNRELSCLKTIFSKAVEWGKIEQNPTAKVKKFREPKGREVYLSDDEIRRLIAAATPAARAIFTVALGTGMRKGEILGLKWENVKFRDGYIFIPDSETKSGKSRHIPISGAVAAVLKAIPREADYVFYNRAKKNRVKDVKTAFRAAIRRAGLDSGIRFHDLRHSAASKMVREGVDLVTVSKILGHSSIQMTMRYAHPSPENLKRAVEILGTLLGGQTEKTVNLPVSENPSPQHLM